MPPARNLIICCDGTSNQFGRRDTNIVKLCQCLQRSDNQLVYYDPGVGTIGDQRTLRWLDDLRTRILGNAIGYGLQENIQQAYDFLAWHYQPGDRVFLFGFSRGAYTARALAALIHMYGLAAPGAGNLTPYLTGMHSDDRDDNDPPNSGGPDHQPTRWEIANSFKKHFARSIPIEFVGVFDTVNSVGLLWNPLSLPFTTANPSVQRVRHAVAIDERRGFFLPALYKPDLTDTKALAKLPVDTKEVWFPGVHSDIGGGYERGQQGLAQLTLKWMLREASAGPTGLLLDPLKYERVIGEPLPGHPPTVPPIEPKYAKPDPAAAQHNSFNKAWPILELIPQHPRVQLPDHTWRRKWFWNLFRRRKIPAGATMHTSVQQRWTTNPNWRPPNLTNPTNYPQEP